jgi:hypothetical protein
VAAWRSFEDMDAWKEGCRLLNYITAKQMNKLVAKARKVAGMIGGVINCLEGQTNR